MNTTLEVDEEGRPCLTVIANVEARGGSGELSELRRHETDSVHAIVTLSDGDTDAGSSINTRSGNRLPAVRMKGEVHCGRTTLSQKPVS